MTQNFLAKPHETDYDDSDKPEIAARIAKAILDIQIGLPVQLKIVDDSDKPEIAARIAEAVLDNDSILGVQIEKDGLRNRQFN